jgi:hypothetical protein
MAMNVRSASPALAGLLLLLSIGMTACAALASPDPLPAEAPSAEGSAVPPFGGSDGAGCSDPGSAEGETPTSDPSPAACAPPPSTGDPDAVVTSPPLDPNASFPPEPQAGLVEPVPGVIDPHPVGVDAISATVEGGRLVARLEWISGVEPCYSLATVAVERDGSTFTLTPLEGPTALDVACIEIAVYKATLVDLGILPAGVYTLQAGEGPADPVTITVP